MPGFDCHAHVYERVYAVGQVRYLPRSPAPLTHWLDCLANHDFDGGVLVQPSFFGDDHRELLAALDRLDHRRFAGVGVLPLSAGKEEMLRLKLRGIRALRWNLIETQELPDITLPQTQAFLKAMREAGLHLEIHLEGSRLAAYAAEVLPHVTKLVVDHFGRPTNPDPSGDPWIKLLDSMRGDDRIWVKFSAPYRNPGDMDAFAAAIIERIGPRRVVFGSDWPWTRHEGETTYAKCCRQSLRWFESPEMLAGPAAELYSLVMRPSGRN